MRAITAMVVLAIAALASACKKSEAAEPQGRDVFGSLCSRCHGANGGGGKPASAGAPAPRNFRDHGFQRSRTDAELKATIKNGRGTAMPAFGDAVDDAQLAALVRHIRTFDPETTGTEKP